MLGFGVSGRRVRGKWLRDWTGSDAVPCSQVPVATAEGARPDFFAEAPPPKSALSVSEAVQMRTGSGSNAVSCKGQRPRKRYSATAASEVRSKSGTEEHSSS